MHSRAALMAEALIDFTAVFVCETCLMAPGVPCVTRSGKPAQRPHGHRLATFDFDEPDAQSGRP